MLTAKDKHVVVGADFAGHPLKEAVKAHLEERGWTVTDLTPDADAPRTAMAMADAFLESSLGSGYEDWDGFYEYHRIGYDECENFDYEAYKANGFEVVNPGFAVLAEQPKGLAY